MADSCDHIKVDTEVFISANLVSSVCICLLNSTLGRRPLNNTKPDLSKILTLKQTQKHQEYALAENVL